VSNGKRKALIVGASGMVGSNLYARLCEEAGWDIVTMSRRPVPQGSTHLHLSTNLLDQAACREAAASLKDVTHIFFCARAVEANYVIKLDENRLIVENLLDALGPVSERLQHVQIVHGMKWYGSNLGPYRTPAKESHPRLPGPNFYYEQLDALIARAERHGWTWSTLRPHFICGTAIGSPSNPISTIGVYAAILREIGEPLHFPANDTVWTAAMNVTDVGLLSKAMVWAATEPRCAGEAFNIVNGDTFCWRDVWPLIAAQFDMAAAGPKPFGIRDFMSDKGTVWQAIAEREGLRFSNVSDIADWAFADVLFTGGWDQTASVVKAHRYGFNGMVDSEEMFGRLFAEYRALKLLP
jgi:nucleoside-diphosphate-sugar epimerase